MSENKTLPLEMRDGTVLRISLELNEKDRWLIITHGVCEHLERYDILAQRFSDSYNILRYDLRGHGQSEGKRHSIDHFTDFAKDLVEIIEFLQNHYQMDEYLLFGHSMGGLINAQFVQHGWHLHTPIDLSHRLSATHKRAKMVLLFLSSPCIRPANPLISAFQMIPNIKKAGLSNALNVKGFIREALLSHATKTNPIYKDLHLSTMSMSLKLLLAIQFYSKRVFSKALAADCPVFATIGTQDAIVSVSAFKNYSETYMPLSKILYIEGGFHELMHESEPYVSEYFKFLDSSLKPFASVGD